MVKTLENFAGLGRFLTAGGRFIFLLSDQPDRPATLRGFWGEGHILWVLAHDGGFGAALVVIIVLNTVLRRFYYFRIIRSMYLEPANDRSRTHRLFARDPLGVIWDRCAPAR